MRLRREILKQPRIVADFVGGAGQEALELRSAQCRVHRQGRRQTARLHRLDGQQADRQGDAAAPPTPRSRGIRRVDPRLPGGVTGAAGAAGAAGAWMLTVKKGFALIMLGMAEYYLVKMGQVYF